MTLAEAADTAVRAHVERASRFATRVLILAGTTCGLLVVVSLYFARSGLPEAATAVGVIALVVGAVLWLVARYVSNAAETDAAVVDALRRDLTALQAQRLNDLTSLAELRQQLHHLDTRLAAAEDAIPHLEVPDAPITGDPSLETLPYAAVESAAPSDDGR